MTSSGSKSQQLPVMSHLCLSKNGQVVGTVYKDMKGPLFPTIAVHSQNEEVHVNFGQKPFAFDLKDFESQERMKQQMKIEEIPLPPNVSYGIVRSYLLHYGYEDTLNSFDVASRSTVPPVYIAQENGVDGQEITYALNHRKTLRQLKWHDSGDSEHDSDAYLIPPANVLLDGWIVLNCATRILIRNGEIDAAFSKLREWYPQVVEDNTSTTCFLLHCQKFIELVRVGALEEAVKYGRIELARFFGLPIFEDLVQDCVALLAYEQPQESSVGYLLHDSQREIVADTVNAMILSTNPNVKDAKNCLRPGLERNFGQFSNRLGENILHASHFRIFPIRDPSSRTWGPDSFTTREAKALNFEERRKQKTQNRTFTSFPPSPMETPYKSEAKQHKSLMRRFHFLTPCSSLRQTKKQQVRKSNTPDNAPSEIKWLLNPKSDGYKNQGESGLEGESALKGTLLAGYETVGYALFVAVYAGLELAGNASRDMGLSADTGLGLLATALAAAYVTRLAKVMVQLDMRYLWQFILAWSLCPILHFSMTNLKGRNLVSACIAVTPITTISRQILQCFPYSEISGPLSYPQPKHPQHLVSLLLKDPSNRQASQQVHSHIITSGLLQYPFYCTSTCLLLFNTLTRCYSIGSFPEEAVKFCVRSQHCHTFLTYPTFDSYTYAFLCHACANSNCFDPGIQFHSIIFKVGFHFHIYVQTALLRMYSTCGLLVEAAQVFYEIPKRNTVTWNVFITGLVRWGELGLALSVFNHMPVRSVVSWTIIMDGFTRANQPAKALTMFREMVVCDGITPSEVTLLTIFPAISNLGFILICQSVHGYSEKRGFNAYDVRIMNSLIDTYSKCGCIASASKFFQEMSSHRKNLVSWTSVISGFAMHGMGREAIEKFENMEKAGMKPNHVTFLSVLNACSHGGLVEEGLKFFNKMANDCQLVPDTKHYGCLIDMLGRAGRLEEAEKIALQVPLKAVNVVIWRTLLGACSFHGNVEISQRVIRKILEMEREYGGDYVLMSNILAGAGRFRDAERLRKVMDMRIAFKLPGYSLF
ncbi:pentatricopeptide repeat-containing protein [Senna tora]|uniref:Pentatricopeptide repeat-containing protein n=1 Tax=Senna tora TaxID=362788 RepID=A0A834TP05_9FABA|nr:pentatricopeptide repeat-containing protein [Senna tora]